MADNIILYLLSGGLANTDPARSFGGIPSVKILSDSVDALFPKVSKAEFGSNDVSYRCLYGMNVSGGSLRDFVIWLETVSDVGAELEMGLYIADEVQQIILTEYPVGGTFVLRYVGNIGGMLTTQETAPIQWVPNLAQMSLNIANALNVLLGLGGITVTASRPAADRWLYTVTFGGASGKRDHLPLEIASNDLIGDPPQLAVVVITEGSPINAVAPDTGFDNQLPNKVSFIEAISRETAVSLGSLEPLDVYALWLRRTITTTDEPSIGTIDSVNIHGSGTFFSA